MLYFAIYPQNDRFDKRWWRFRRKLIIIVFQSNEF